jgi:demethylsterigmatocystin 6-O-methyltransferase
MQQPIEVAQNFGLWMQAIKAGQPIWLDNVPLEELVVNKDPEQTIFVDIYGSIGHQCAALKERYPDLTGKVIYQDLPPVLVHELEIPGVEAQPYDFFTEQPIKGNFLPNYLSLLY